MNQIIQKAIEGRSGYSLITLFSKGKTHSIEVDTVDLPRLSRYKWHLTDNGYAIAWIDGKRVRMTHFLLGKPKKGWEIDHINRKRLDNRRANLRIITGRENRQNVSAVGVRKHGKGWEANVCIDYKKYFKSFPTKEEALEWRDKIKPNGTN